MGETPRTHAMRRPPPRFDRQRREQVFPRDDPVAELARHPRGGVVAVSLAGRCAVRDGRGGGHWRRRGR